MNSTEPGTGSVKSYLTGFILAIVLTVIPFALVMNGVLSWTATIIAIFAAAVLQMLVHLHYFLHLDASSQQRWNVLAIVFTGIIVLLLVGGSVWIMFSLHDRTRYQASVPAPVARRVG